MADNTEILVLDDPTIKLEELSIDDYESNSDNQKSFITNNSIRSNTASLSPIVKINDFIINASYFESFEIDCTGFIPTCDVVFYDVSEQFTESNYPKDGDLMKVYIGSGGKEETWKPIRIDFQILSIEPFEEDGVKGFSISGEMEIPGFELDKCEVFQDKSSFDTCRAIAKNLKLGFSSNIRETDDAQIWINNYGTESSFLKRIINHAYVDENSFVTSFIDPYYYFNFVECNSIINDADNDDRSIEELDRIKYVTNNINADHDFKDEEENLAPDFITNSNYFSASNIGIKNFGQVNNCSSIVQKNGKKIYIRYWDDISEEYRVEFITPFVSEGQDIKSVIYKEDDEESVKQNTKKIIMHAQTENMHKNYNYSEVCNKINLDEINKYGLSVSLAGFNAEITRFQKKYVAIYTKSLMAKSDIMDKEIEKEGQSTTTIEDDFVLNRELSGFYTVTGIIYSLEEEHLTTQLELRKRAIKTNKQ